MASLANARQAAPLVWAGLIVLPLAFLAVVLTVGPHGPVSPGLTPIMFWVAVVGSAFEIALSRLLPQRLGSASSGRDTVAFTRMMVAWALCESAALFPLVAWLITGDVRLVGLFAVDLLALILLYPSEGQWERFAPPGTARPAARRMVR